MSDRSSKKSISLHYSHLWNDLPANERQRLMPHLIEVQLLNVWRCKQKAILAHKRHMKELDEWMSNLDCELRRLARDDIKPEGE